VRGRRRLAQLGGVAWVSETIFMCLIVFGVVPAVLAFAWLAECVMEQHWRCFWDWLRDD
jgi:hypothetical protein